MFFKWPVYIPTFVGRSEIRTVGNLNVVARSFGIYEFGSVGTWEFSSSGFMNLGVREFGILGGWEFRSLELRSLGKTRTLKHRRLRPHCDRDRGDLP